MVNNFLKAFKNLVPNKIRLNEGKHYLRTGTSGTSLFSGYFDEEYLRELLSVQGMELYDEMRRSDGHIKMLLKVVKNPILSANWAIEGVDDSEEEIFIKEFIEHVLFEDIGNPDGTKIKTFEEFLEEALTVIDFGFYLGEVVHKVVTDHPKFGSYIGLRDIAFRSQKTIETWNIERDGGLKSVEQEVEGDLEFSGEIPGKFLLHLAVNKEGDNYEGISELRPLYGNFIRKNVKRKLEIIGFERNAVGAPVGTFPANADDEEIDVFEKALESYTTHEDGYIIKPEGWEIDELKLTFNAEGMKLSIDGENVEMTKAFIANFMELGLNGSGSFALGSDLSDIFLGGLGIYANKIKAKINRQIIPHLVKCKFGERAKYPKLTVSGINDKAGKEFADILKLLVDAQIIDPRDSRLKAFTHNRFNLPEFTESLEDETINTDNDTTPPNPDSTDEDGLNLSELGEGKDRYKLADKKKTKKLITDTAQELEKVMIENLSIIAKNWRKDVKAKVGKDKPSRSLSKVRAVKLRGSKKYKEDLENILFSLILKAYNGAVDELPGQNEKIKLADAKAKLTPALREKGISETLLLLESQQADLAKSSNFGFSSSSSHYNGVDEVLGEVEDVQIAYIEGNAIRTASVNAISELVNSSRIELFTTPEVFEEIESFIFSNPDPKSPICKNLSGRVFNKNDPSARINLPPLHHNCKSIIVPQFNGVKGNLPINTKGLNPSTTNPDGTRAEINSILKSRTFRPPAPSSK